MIPLFLITGFLGSGKTTLLRLLTEQARARRCVCIVNEFSAVDIDGQLIDLPPGQLVSIPGGSIFCRCLAGEFIRVLNHVAQADCSVGNKSTGINPAARMKDVVAPEAVLIEASGIADPKVIAQMLAETRLDQTYDLRRIITVVDPDSFLKLVHTLPNIIAQVQASDLVLINKTDLYEAEQVDACKACVREINPTAQIVRTRYCKAPIDVFREHEHAGDKYAAVERFGGDKPRRSLEGEYAPCADPNFHTRTITFKEPVDRDKLLTALQALQPHIYRAKGFVPTTDGCVYVDVSVAGLSCRAADGSNASGDLVIIAGPDQQLRMDEFARCFQILPGLNVLG